MVRILKILFTIPGHHQRRWDCNAQVTNEVSLTVHTNLYTYPRATQINVQIENHVAHIGQFTFFFGLASLLTEGKYKCKTP